MVKCTMPSTYEYFDEVSMEKGGSGHMPWWGWVIIGCSAVALIGAGFGLYKLCHRSPVYKLCDSPVYKQRPEGIIDVINAISKNGQPITFKGASSCNPMESFDLVNGGGYVQASDIMDSFNESFVLLKK